MNISMCTSMPIFSVKTAKSERVEHLRNPWWIEGGAEYMAQLLYSRQPDVRDDYLKDKMKQKLRAINDLGTANPYEIFPMGSEVT